MKKRTFQKLSLPSFEKALDEARQTQAARDAAPRGDVGRLIASLLKAIEAKDALLSCYRLGRRPSETLFKKLEAANAAVEKAKEFLK